VLAGYALVVLWVALAGGLAGATIGWAAQAGLVLLLGDLLPADLPTPSFAALPGAIALGGVVLAGFALPPVIALGRTPPLRVLRRDLGPVSLPAQLASLAAAAAIAALLVVQTKDLRLAGYTLGGLGAVVLAFGITALVMLKLLGRLRGRVGVAWRYGVANVVRRGRESVAQLTAFGIGIAVLLLLTLTRSGLLEDWRAALPVDAPNRFHINIQTDERVAVTGFLTARGLPAPTLAPMVRARLVAIDGVAIEQVKLDNPRLRNFAEREANLSFSAVLPYGNEVWEGRFWDAAALPAEPEVSFEFEIGKALGLKIGSTVTYDVVGEQVTARVTSLRKVDWDSFRPNFFILFSPGSLEQAPATWITSMHLPSARAPLLIELTRAFPSVTVIDTDVILDQVRDVIARASLTVEFVFLFTLGAGVLVLLAAVQASRDERRFESAVLRTLGAKQRTVLAGVAAEFLLLGLLAGLLAVLAAGALEWLLAEQVFEMEWRPDPLLALAGGLLGTLLVGATGVLATRDVVTHPPVETLRRG
jgi:putative ABC transport system permease protein